MTSNDLTRGDEVLYRNPDNGKWVSAAVLEIAPHDGDLMLDTGEGRELAALDVKHGLDLHNWSSYEELAKA